MGLTKLQLSSVALDAAEGCLAAVLPLSTGEQLRGVARRCAAFDAELGAMAGALEKLPANTMWHGSASEAFEQHLQKSRPNLAATATRFGAYSRALTGYALDIDEMSSQLRLASRRVFEARQALLDDLAAAGPIMNQLPVAAPVGSASAGSASAGSASAAIASQDAAASRAGSSERELARVVAQFVVAYDHWIDALQICVAAIRHADLSDPTRDLHGWSLWRHRFAAGAATSAHAIARYVDPVAEAIAHPSWSNASNALGFISANLTLIGLGLLMVVAPLGVAVLIIAAAFSAAQFAVDAWRRWGEHEQVSAMSLIMDGVGSVPSASFLREGRLVAGAGRAAARQASGAARITAFASAAAPPARAAAGRAIGEPIEFFQPGWRQLPSDLYRSTSHGGAGSLAARWAAPLLWDASNAVTGLPNLNAGGSTPQFLWQEMQALHATHDPSAPGDHSSQPVTASPPITPAGTNSSDLGGRSRRSATDAPTLTPAPTRRRSGERD